MTDKSARVVSGVYVTDGTKGTILVGRRSGDRDYAGCWESPGGKVEPEESDHDALRREWREELSVELQRIDSEPLLTWDSGLGFVIVAYRVRGWAGLPTPTAGVHDLVSHLLIKDLRVLPSTPSMLHILAALEASYCPGCGGVGYVDVMRNGEHDTVECPCQAGPVLCPACTEGHCEHCMTDPDVGLFCDCPADLHSTSPVRRTYDGRPL